MVFVFQNFVNYEIYTLLHGKCIIEFGYFVNESIVGEIIKQNSSLSISERRRRRRTWMQQQIV